MVCQALLAYGSTPNPDVEDYKGQIGLSSPAAYPSTMGNETNEGSLYPRHHVYAIDYYSSAIQGYPSLSGVLYKSILYENNDEPASK